MIRRIGIVVAIGLLSIGVAPLAYAQGNDLTKLEKQRAPRPTEMAIVFSYGYARDHMPTDDKHFEKFLLTIKKGHFNVVHCPYTEGRLALCKKHGVKMMVDFLAPTHHVYRSPEKCEAVAKKLRGHPAVWGYNVWNDNYGKTGRGRRRDVNSARKWDPTHPSISGTYRTYGMNHLVNADVMSFYDFHWKRKRAYHFPHILSYSRWAKERNSWFYRWVRTVSGLPGRGNYNRGLYTVNTSLAVGLKGYMWFLGGDLLNLKTLQWSQAGKDVIRINAQVAPLSKEIVKLGHPQDVYSTPITKSANNDPLPKLAMPSGLEKSTFPKDFWLTPQSGEFLMGVYRLGPKSQAIFLANHNAYIAQKVQLKTSQPVTASLFDRQKGAWRELPTAGGMISFDLGPAGGELLRVAEK